MRKSDAIRAIKERINIVDIVRRYVDLKQNGTRFIAPCPFHQETKPSFSVNPDEGFFYCFGCQAAGDIFEFYSRINGIDFKDSLEQLAAEAGINLESDFSDNKVGKKDVSEKSILLKLHELGARHFKNNLLSSEGQECRNYIKKRGLSEDICERFELGWAQRDWHSLEQYFRKSSCNLNLACEAGLLAKSSSGKYYDRFRGRFIFPIKNLSGQIIAFGGRIIGNEEEAKYINSPDTLLYHKKEHLFGLAQARKGISTQGCAILTEGYMDVLTLHQFGYTNSVGVLGTALTAEQINRLGGFTSKIVLVFDGDGAGKKAALRSAAMFLARGLACSVVSLPEQEDIDSLLRNGGSRAFDSLLKTAPEGLKFCTGVLRTYAPREALKWVKDFMATLEMPELFSLYASRFAQELGFSENSLRMSINPAKRRQPTSLPVRKLVDNSENMRDMQILIFAARYPEKLEELKKIGAHLALSSSSARQFWDLIESWGPEEILEHMDDAQKSFWHKHRLPPAPPLDNYAREFENLKNALDNFYTQMHANSLSAALSTHKLVEDFEAGIEYLKALQEAMEKNK